MTRKIFVRENGIPGLVDESEIKPEIPPIPSKLSELEDDLGVAKAADVAAGYVAKTGDNAGVTLNDDQTITGTKTFTKAVTVGGAITASGPIKASGFTADNGVNTNFDFRDAHDSKGGGWVLSSGSHTPGRWATIATTESTVAKANSVEASGVPGLAIGAKTISSTGGGVTVKITRSSLGQVTDVGVACSNRTICSDCNCCDS